MVLAPQRDENFRTRGRNGSNVSCGFYSLWSSEPSHSQAWTPLSARRPGWESERPGALGPALFTCCLERRDANGPRIDLRAQICNSPWCFSAGERTCFSLIYLETEFLTQKRSSCLFFLGPDCGPSFPKGVSPAFLEFSDPAPSDLPVTVRPFPALTPAHSVPPLTGPGSGHFLLDTFALSTVSLWVCNQRRPAQVWTTI